MKPKPFFSQNDPSPLFSKPQSPVRCGRKKSCNLPFDEYGALIRTPHCFQHHLLNRHSRIAQHSIDLAKQFMFPSYWRRVRRSTPQATDRVLFHPHSSGYPLNPSSRWTRFCGQYVLQEVQQCLYPPIRDTSRQCGQNEEYTTFPKQSWHIWNTHCHFRMHKRAEPWITPHAQQPLLGRTNSIDAASRWGNPDIGKTHR